MEAIPFGLERLPAIIRRIAIIARINAIRGVSWSAGAHCPHSSEVGRRLFASGSWAPGNVPRCSKLNLVCLFSRTGLPVPQYPQVGPLSVLLVLPRLLLYLAGLPVFHALL